MASWAMVGREAPELAERVAARFAAHRHHTIATLRADGSPRVSGTEVAIIDGRLTFGVMEGAVRTRDLHRDPRLALHSQNLDPPEHDPSAWPGEAKVSGRAVPIDGPPSEHTGEAPPGAHFTVDVDEIVLTTIGADGEHLVVEWWTPESGVRRVERR